MGKSKHLLKISGLYCTAFLAGLCLLSGSAHADSNQSQLTINQPTDSQTTSSASQQLQINQGSQSLEIVDNEGQKTSDGDYQNMVVPHYDHNHHNPYADLINPPSRPVTTNTSHGNRMDVVSVPKNSRENEVKNVNVGSLDSAQTVDWSNGKTDLMVSGWHLAGTSNERPYRWLILYDSTDKRELSRQAVNGAIVRNDVAKAYPKFSNAAYAGFDAKFKLPDSAKGHQLAIISRFSDDENNGEGQYTDYWMQLDDSNHAWLDQAARQGNKLQVSGWHAAGKAYGRLFHYLIVIDAQNGHEYGRQLVEDPVERPDVAKVYPKLLGADQSGFKTEIQLGNGYEGRTLRLVSRYTDDSAGNPSTNFVDYYFKPMMMKQNRGWLDSWSVADGSLKVQGWHAADAALTSPYHYLIVFDHTAGRQVACLQTATQASSDVAKAMPGIYQSGQARFKADLGHLSLLAGHRYSLVSRYSSLNGGNGDGKDAVKTDYWFNLGSLTSQSFGYLDKHVLKDDQLNVAGWAASSLTADKPYLQLIAVDDAGELGRTTAKILSRPDVAAAYPHVYNSQMSGYNDTIHLSRAVKGRIRLVVRYTNLLNGYDPKRCVDFYYQL